LGAGVEVQDAWHIIRWYWAAVLAVYFAVQILAAWRLKGIQKKRSYAVATAMVILSGLSDAIRYVFFFENREAHLIAMLALAIAAIVATIVLVVIFCERPSEIADSQYDEHRIQSLNLN
jgi:uncharacterized membrane protein